MKRGWPVAALLISLGVAAIQIKMQGRLNAIEMQRRDEEIEARLAANVVPGIRKVPSSSLRPSYRLVLTNRGQAEARQVTFDSAAFGNDLVGGDKHLPIPSLVPGQEYEMPLAPDRQSPLRYEVVIEWHDNNPDGVPVVYPYTLSRP